MFIQICKKRYPKHSHVDSPKKFIFSILGKPWWSVNMRRISVTKTTFLRASLILFWWPCSIKTFNLPTKDVESFFFFFFFLNRYTSGIDQWFSKKDCGKIWEDGMGTRGSLYHDERSRFSNLHHRRHHCIAMHKKKASMYCNTDYAYHMLCTYWYFHYLMHFIIMQ